MPASSPEEIVYLSPSRGLLPENASPAWVKVGGGSVAIVGDAFVLTDASGTNRLLYYRPFIDADRRTQATAAPSSRPADALEVQSTMRVSAYTAWTGDTSPAGLLISDGERALGLAVGAALRLVDPATGGTVLEVFPAWDYANAHSYLLRKDQHQRWVLSVDGKEAAVLGYDRAPAAPGRPTLTSYAGPVYALGAWGVIGQTGTATVEVYRHEQACNLAIPRQWKIERFTGLLPLAVQERWGPLFEGFMRACSGVLEGAQELMGQAGLSLTAARFPQYEGAFTGDVLPDTLDPAWTVDAGVSAAVVRQRLRVTSSGSAAEGFTLSFGGTLYPTSYESQAGATWILREYAADSEGRVGPVVRVSDGTKQAVAQMIEVGDAVCWALTDGAVFGGTAPALLGTPRPVDPAQAHAVSVYLFTPDWALLVIDGEIVDKVPYADLDSAGTARAQILVTGDAGNVADVTDGIGARRVSDFRKRPMFLQDTIERLIPVGGCERNDELEVWARSKPDLHRIRGTTQAIIVELRRLACSDQVAVVSDASPAGWWLDLSFPDWDAVFLDMDGYLTDIWVETPNIRTMTIEDFAVWVCRYLLPISVLELEYHFCLAQTLTGSSSVPSPGLTRLPVASSLGFAPGDTVTVRDAANTAQVEATIAAIPSATAIDVGTISARIAGDVVRKLIASS